MKHTRVHCINNSNTVSTVCTEYIVQEREMKLQQNRTSISLLSSQHSATISSAEHKRQFDLPSTIIAQTEEPLFYENFHM